MSEDAKPKRVAVLIGNTFGTVDEADLPKMPKGTRVLSSKEVEAHDQQEAEARDDARYEKLPTAVKAAGIAQDVVGALVPGGGGLAIGSAHGSLPQAKSYGEGVTQGVTAGVGQGVARQALDATMGHEAGDRYAASVTDSRLAHPAANALGEMTGMGAGIVAPIGGAAEQVAAKGLARAGIQGTTALGRAGMTAAELGFRGAVEGAALKGGEYVGDTLLQDHDFASEKLFSAMGTGALYGGTTGAVLGAGGSLLKSGAGAVRSAALDALNRPIQSVTAAVEGAGQRFEDGVMRGASAIDDAAARVAPTIEDAAARARAAAGDFAADGAIAARNAAKSLVSEYTTEAGLKGQAYDQMWKVIGGGMGLQSTEYAQRAAKFLPNGVRDVSEVLARKGIFNPRAGILEEATPKSMLPNIEAALADTGKKLGAMTDASGGMVDVRDIVKSLQDVARPYAESAATRPVAREIERFGLELADSLVAGKAGPVTHVPIQDLLRERKALDLMVFENAALNTSSVPTQVKRELRSKLENLVVDALDSASGRMSGELATEYKALKKDYLALNIARDVAEDSAARIAKKATLGLSDLTAGGGSLVKAIAYKAVKERGNAAAARLLYQEAERGTLARLVAKTDDQLARAAKGLITSPPKGATDTAIKMPSAKDLAAKGFARVRAFNADPEAFVDAASRNVESIGSHSPEIADGIVQRQVRAMVLLSSKMPYQGEPDPLDPHKPFDTTPLEQSEFARYTWYCDKPERFFAEVSRGKLTPEGAEVAQQLMPRAFEQLQNDTYEALTTQLARGNRLPFRQRELLGQLLDFAATPAQRPDHRLFLQQNVDAVLPSNERITTAGPKGPRRTTTSQNVSALDRLEGKGPGRR